MATTLIQIVLLIKVEVLGQNSMGPMKLHEIGLGEGESCVLSYHHFRSMLRLCGEGLNPQKYGIDGYVTKVECIKLWGPKKRHNGFKFKVDGNPLELREKIRHLNIVIYSERIIKHCNLFGICKGDYC